MFDIVVNVVVDIGVFVKTNFDIFVNVVFGVFVKTNFDYFAIDEIMSRQLLVFDIAIKPLHLVKVLLRRIDGPKHESSIVPECSL